MCRPSSIWTLLLCFICSLLLIISVHQHGLAQVHLSDVRYQAAAQEFQLGKQQYEQQSYIQSLRHLQEAQRLFDSGQYSIQLALVQSNLALIYHELGQQDKAEELVDNALDTPRLSNYPQVKARALDIKAKLLAHQGKYIKALENWQKAEPIYQQSADRVGQLTNKINRAYAHMSLGQHAEFYALLQDIQAQIYRPDFNTQFSLPTDQQLVTQQVTRFLKAAGRYDEAIAFLKPQIEQHPEQADYQLQLAELFQIKGDRADDGNVYFQPSSSPWECNQLSENQYLRNANYREAIATYQHVLHSHPSAATQLQAQIQLLKLLYRTHQENQARKLTSQVSLSVLIENRELVSQEIKLAQALNCVEPNQALGLLNQALKHAENLRDPYSSSEIMGNIGGYYAKQIGDLIKAKKFTRNAQSIAQAANMFSLDYQWLWQLGQITKQEYSTEESLDYYDSATRRLERLRYNYIDLSQERRFSFLDDIRPFYQEYLALLLDNNNPENLRVAESLMTNLQLAEVEDLLRCQSVNLEPITVTNHPGTTIIYPVLLGDRLGLIAELPGDQTSKQIDKRKIPDQDDGRIQYFPSVVDSQEIPKLISTLNNFKAWVKKDNFIDAELLRWGQELYQYLVTPLETKLPENGTLIFVVDSYLQGLPFAALHDGQQYLIEKYSVAVSIGSQFKNLPSASHDNSVVLAGISDAPGYWWERGLSQLPNVGTELDGIAALTQGRTLRNSELKSSDFKATLEKDTPSTIHLATHGEFNADPDLMQLFLWDEPLTVNQFAQMLRVGADRNPEPINLLVLSACETATGDQRATLGMAGTAIRANATSTVASLWKVSDRSTAELMEYFYTGLLKENLSKVEALRQAQVKLLDEQLRFDGKVNPYNWAAFVLAGDWH